jgi:hypothetical protein
MEVVVILIEFASSELWRSHLHPSNFASCEDIVSTDEGRNSALEEMFSVALAERPEFLCTPTKIITAIRRLEELGCLNTAQVVIAWAWVTGMADVMDQDGWKLVEGETLRFYQTHGIRSLAALKRCIAQNRGRGPELVSNPLFRSTLRRISVSSGTFTTPVTAIVFGHTLPGKVGDRLRYLRGLSVEEVVSPIWV